MSERTPKSLAFEVNYNNIAHELKTQVILFAVSAPAPNKSVVINAIWDTGATHISYYARNRQVSPLIRY